MWPSQQQTVMTDFAATIAAARHGDKAAIDDAEVKSGDSTRRAFHVARAEPLHRLRITE